MDSTQTRQHVTGRELPAKKWRVPRVCDVGVGRLLHHRGWRRESRGKEGFLFCWSVKVQTQPENHGLNSFKSLRKSGSPDKYLCWFFELQVSKLFCFFIFNFSKATAHKHILGNKLHLPNTWLENKWLSTSYILKGKPKVRAWKDRPHMRSWTYLPTETATNPYLLRVLFPEPMLGTHGSSPNDKISHTLDMMLRQRSSSL